MINQNIMRELESAYLYMGLAAQSDYRDWPGFAHWFDKQSDEEFEHARKLIDFMRERRELVEYQTLDEPDVEADDMADVVEVALKAEIALRDFIHAQAHKAEDADPAYREFLDWYIAEQVEEIEQLKRLLADVKRSEGDFSAMLIIDRELAQR